MNDHVDSHKPCMHFCMRLRVQRLTHMGLPSCIDTTIPHPPMRPCMQAAAHGGAQRYMVYIDGGSSGTRVHVFRYTAARWPAYVRLELPEATQSVEPGLSAHADAPEAAASSLDKLLAFAHEQVSSAAAKRVPGGGGGQRFTADGHPVMGKSTCMHTDDGNAMPGARHPPCSRERRPSKGTLQASPAPLRLHARPALPPPHPTHPPSPPAVGPAPGASHSKACDTRAAAGHSRAAAATAAAGGCHPPGLPLPAGGLWLCV